MSSFDDEFGLFGDEDAAPEEEERRSTLGARQIATNQSFSDDIEPEDERPVRRRSGGGDRGGERRPFRERDHGPRPAGVPAVAQARAVELLIYLAKKLVSKPDEVIVEVVEGSRGPVIELEVHPEDFGKVIGKGGRVAQALRTIVRASAEGRVTIDIIDVEDDDEEDPPEAEPGTTVVEAAAVVVEEPAAGDEDVADAPAVKKPAARKKRASTAAAPKRKKKS